MKAPAEIKLKVCGMLQPENIMSVAALKPDYMGFIFFNKSPRNVGDSLFLPSNFPTTIKRVGVFVNDGLEIILQQTQRHSLDYIQLHGVDDSVRFCEELYDHGLKVIKAFSIDDHFDFESTTPYQRFADYFLFDTKGKLQGGNGIKFNWRALEKYNQHVPFFLSGGLNQENIKTLDSLKGMNIHALDINSGVEVYPGFKDIDRIRAIQEILTSINH
jgi:phosphoribosylanthranilate isomerase